MANLKPLHKALIGLTLIVLANWACISGELVVTVTPTAEVWATPESTESVLPTLQPTSTEVLANTLAPTLESVGKCVVTVDVAVYLRPSPSEENYPITELANGSELEDLGGKDGDWLFVRFADKEGWVYGKYISGCD